MPHKKPIKLSAVAIALSYLLAGQTYAQEDQNTEETASEDETIVIVGHRAKPLIETSVPITQIGAEEINQTAPRNIADILTLVPSMQVENTSGNTNNEYRFRGIGAGGTQFLEFEEDGIPIQRDAPDFLYRVSNAIDGIDVIRGGNAPILRTAAIGAVVNFKYKEGSQDKTEGDIFFQSSDFGMLRTEMWTGGPLSENTTYSVAGYYTTDDGVREVDFAANEGYNLYSNVKYHFADSSGHFKVSARKFQENNIVYLAVPLKGDPSNPEPFPGGPDITTGSILSSEIALANSFSAPNEPSLLDLRPGNANKMSYVGTEFKKTWFTDGDVLTFVSRNRYTDVTSRFSGYYAAGFALGGDFQTGSSLVPNMLNSNTMGAGLVNYSYAMPAGFNPTGFSVTNQQGGVLDSGTINDLNGNGIIEPGEVASTSATLANGNGIFMPVAAFDQEKPFTSFQQDIELNYQFDTLNAEHFIAVGYYYLNMDRGEQNRQQLFLTDLKPQASRVDVNLTNDLGESVTLTDSGFLTHNHWLNALEISDDIKAIYANYEVVMEDLTLDVGLRQDDFSFLLFGAGTTNYFGNGPNQVPLPEPGTTVSPAVTSIQRFNGSFGKWDDWNTKKISYTLGANYVIEDDFAVYGRYTQGYLPNPRGATGTETLELGLRYQNDAFGIAANFFSMTQEGDVQERGIVIDGEEVIARLQTDRESMGLELEGDVIITDDFKFLFSATFQQPEFASGGSATPAPGSSVTQQQLNAAVGDLTSISGNQIANQPEVLGTLGLVYDLTIDDVGTISFSTFLRHVGEIPLDDANSNFIDSYSQVNAGVNFESTSGDWYARVNIQNLTDEEAIQRVFGGPQSIVEQGVASDGFYGRPLLGRNIVFGVGYRF